MMKFVLNNRFIIGDSGSSCSFSYVELTYLRNHNYRRALQTAEEELKRRPFNFSLLLRLHEVLLDSVCGKYARRTHAGIAIR